MTVPNIPLWTGLHSNRKRTGFALETARSLVTENGRGTPFVNVTFDGLLWGYEDDLPCLRMDLPSECADADSPFSSSFGDEDDDDFDDGFDFRRKREVTSDVEKGASEYAGLAKPKAEFVNCACQWGLFRDRNVTMRKPVRFFTGVTDLSMKGVVVEFDNSKSLNWWKPGSECDKVKGQDSSTLPPQITEKQTLDIFIALMCRRIAMKYEKVSHSKTRLRLTTECRCSNELCYNGRTSSMLASGR